MKKLVLSSLLCLGLVALGTRDASAAAPYCIDFSNFCDCLSVTPTGDSVDGQTIRRTAGTWENQDCAGTTSAMQGIARDSAQSFTGELNSALGLDGTNFNFTIAGGVFDLDATGIGKVQNESPYVRVPGVCPADCSALRDKSALPPSRTKK